VQLAVQAGPQLQSTKMLVS